VRRSRRWVAIRTTRHRPGQGTHHRQPPQGAGVERVAPATLIRQHGRAFRYGWRVEHNNRFLGEVARQALANIGEHSPQGSVIVEAVVICRVFGPDGTVSVVTDHVPRGGWQTPAELPNVPNIADTMTTEAERLRRTLNPND
jgi:hypothetical protein